MNTPSKRLKTELALRKRGATANRVEQARAERLSEQRGLAELGRTFGGLVETLSRSQNRGEEKAMAPHLSTAEDGEAIVGNLNGCAGHAKLLATGETMAARIDHRRASAEIMPKPVPSRRPAAVARRRVFGAALRQADSAARRRDAR